MADTADVTTEEVEEARRARAAELAAMPLDELYAQADDAELRAEARRVSREFERPRRVWAVAHHQALANLDASLAKLPAYADAACEALRRESLSGPPSPHTVVQALVAVDAGRGNANMIDRLRAALEPDGVSIATGDPRREAAAHRLALDERRTLIGQELERRELVRRGVLATSKGGKR